MKDKLVCMYAYLNISDIELHAYLHVHIYIYIDLPSQDPQEELPHEIWYVVLHIYVCAKVLPDMRLVSSCLCMYVCLFMFTNVCLSFKICYAVLVGAAPMYASMYACVYAHMCMSVCINT
jgi:hypothetical protein